MASEKWGTLLSCLELVLEVSVHGDEALFDALCEEHINQRGQHSSVQVEVRHGDRAGVGMNLHAPRKERKGMKRHFVNLIHSFSVIVVAVWGLLYCC